MRLYKYSVSHHTFCLLILCSTDNSYLQQLLIGVCQMLIYFISIIPSTFIRVLLWKLFLLSFSQLYQCRLMNIYFILWIIIHYYNYCCPNYPRFYYLFFGTTRCTKLILLQPKNWFFLQRLLVLMIGDWYLETKFGCKVCSLLLICHYF